MLLPNFSGRFSEGYAPKTSYYALLAVGSLKPAYDKLKK